MRIKQSNYQKALESFKAYLEISYSEGHYIEVMILLYHSISAFMNITFNKVAEALRFVINGTDKGFGSLKNEYHGIKEYDFRPLAHMLFEMGIYSKDLHDDLNKFQDFRNVIMHRFFTSKLNKSKFDKYYRLGIKLQEQTSKISLEISKTFVDSIERLRSGHNYIADLLGQVRQEE